MKIQFSSLLWVPGAVASIGLGLAYIVKHGLSGLALAFPLLLIVALALWALYPDADAAEFLEMVPVAFCAAFASALLDLAGLPGWLELVAAGVVLFGLIALFK